MNRYQGFSAIIASNQESYGGRFKARDGKVGKINYFEVN